eukprot:5338041-Prymnesium_polylepis.1
MWEAAPPPSIHCPHVAGGSSRATRSRPSRRVTRRRSAASATRCSTRPPLCLSSSSATTGPTASR